MTDLATAESKSKSRKLLIQTGAGALCGFLGMLGGMWLLDSGMEGLPPPTIAFGFGVGLVYLLTGLLVGAGTLAPQFGARALNVEDADEIYEERPKLVGGTLIYLCIAALMFALTLAPAPLGAGLIGPFVATVVAGAAFAGLVIATFVYRDLGDEMMQRASLEAGNLTLALVFLIFGAWAALNQLGRAEMFGPLLFIGGVFALHLIAVFAVCGARGMLKPR